MKKWGFVEVETNGFVVEIYGLRVRAKLISDIALLVTHEIVVEICGLQVRAYIKYHFSICLRINFIIKLIKAIP